MSAAGACGFSHSATRRPRAMKQDRAQHVRSGKATSDAWKRWPSCVTLAETASMGWSGVSSWATGERERKSQQAHEAGGPLEFTDLTSRQNRFPGSGDEERVPVVRDVEDEEDDLEQLERLGKVRVQLGNAGEDHSQSSASTE